MRVGSAGIGAGSYCGTWLALHGSELGAESHHYAEAGGKGGGSGRCVGNEASARGDWQGMKAGGDPSRGASYVRLCKQVCAGCWMRRPSRHTNLACQAAQHEGAAAWIWKVRFVLAAFLVRRGGKAKDLRLSLGGSCLDSKARRVAA